MNGIHRSRNLGLGWLGLAINLFCLCVVLFVWCFTLCFGLCFVGRGSDWWGRGSAVMGEVFQKVLFTFVYSCFGVKVERRARGGRAKAGVESRMCVLAKGACEKGGRLLEPATPLWTFPEELMASKIDTSNICKQNKATITAFTVGTFRPPPKYSTDMSRI